MYATVLVILIFFVVFVIGFMMCYLLSSKHWENRYRLNVEEYIRRRKNEDREK